ncbi:MAG: ATP-binding cassette domain-containing protein [Solirubrobacteraceae bacterium]|nr:ATP-binding cassette domain-containing protein [Solirubrobacteraceae bacterium]
MSHAIVTRGLEKRYPKGGTYAVQGVDLAVDHGEVYGFLGPNGAGKSTMVRLLVTLLRPSAGTAHVAGHDVVKDPAGVRASIGVALQDAAIDPLMTGRELLELQAVLHGLSRRASAPRGALLLERVGLSDAGDKRVGEYSGGMRRRLDLAMALIHEPRVLFLDEPTTGLDPSSRLLLWDEVRRLRDQGTTVFLTTQYLEEADQLADRVGIIAGGQLVAEDTPEALKAQVGHPHVHVVLTNAADRERSLQVASAVGDPRPGVTDHCLDVSVQDGSLELPALVRALDDAGIAVASLDVVRPTLDDVFLQKTGAHLAEEAVA